MLELDGRPESTFLTAGAAIVDVRDGRLVVMTAALTMSVPFLVVFAGAELLELNAEIKRLLFLEDFFEGNVVFVGIGRV